MEPTLNFSTIFFSMYMMKELERKLSSILLHSLFFIIFIVENDYFIITIEIRKVSMSIIATVPNLEPS